jgi:hypothetical protein
MKAKKLLFSIFVAVLSLISMQSNAQNVSISGATGIVDGTSYSTLKLAFDAINATASQTGANILVKVNATTDEGVAQCALMTKTAGNEWATLKIYPTFTGVTVSGSFTGAQILLSGVKNVTIDGSLNGNGSSKDLTITNTAKGAIVLTADASNNTIKNCVIKGGNTTATAGIIYTSTAATTGMDNNTITNNDITNSGSRPYYAVNILGTTGSTNDGNIVSNNNLYNVWVSGTAAVNTAAVYVGNFTTNTKVTGNSIYETAAYAFAPTNTCTISGILFSNTVAGTDGTEISGNYIGGTSIQCGGSNLEITPSAFKTSFRAINFSGGAVTGTAHTISLNTIKNISILGSFSEAVYGIYGAGPGLQISSNIIDNISNTAATATATLQGITSSSTSLTAPLLISNNTIKNLTNNSTSGGYDFGHSLAGIVQWGTGAATVSGNTVLNLTNNTTVQGTREAGIILAGACQDPNKVVAINNFIKGIYVPDQTVGWSLIYGIRCNGSNVTPWGVGATIVNNIVSLDGNSKAQIWGIYDRAYIDGTATTTYTSLKCYYNTVIISGTTSASQCTWSLYQYVANSKKDIRNNIFINTRTTSDNNFKNFAMGGTAIGATSATDIVDFNNYFVSGTNTALYGAASPGVNTLASIKSSTGGDANSVNVDPLFTNAGGILAEDYKTSSSVTTLVATPIVGYETDFAGITRTIPRMGAYENSITTKLTNIEQGNEFSIISNLSGIVVLLTKKSSIELYNINGMLIEKVIADGAYSRNLNNGMYVIRVNGKAVKFIK